MSLADSPRPVPLTKGFSKLETLPEGFAERMRADVQPGDVIGERYKIISALGGGAMGQIFLAENVAIGLRVAVKLLKPELLANPDFRLRFKHEAEAVAAIQHPNVARFLDLVVDDPTFLVMELVEGPTLADLLSRESSLSPKRAAEIALRLCWGLHAAHKAGVIHRDLKPANILMQKDDETGEVPKIIDFGLAKVAAATQKGAPLTRVGQIIGTPEYMAPEQIGSKDIDARADVYALGCVLYAMLTGRPPFHHNTDDVQVLYRQVHEPATPVTRYALHVGAELEAVVMRALAKDPAERWQSMREFAEALKPFANPRERPALLGEETQVIAKAPKPEKRWPWVVALVASLVSVGSLGWSRMKPAPPDTLVMVISDPAGASLELDGKPIADVTPAALRGIAPGQHQLTLKRDHYGEASRFVQLEAGKRATVSLPLPPKHHIVELNTVPDGATVFLDGNLVAHRTPLAVDVSDEDYHRLRIEKEGYETVEQRLQPEANEKLPRIVLEREKNPRATLFVDSVAPTEVWIDENFSGFSTPTPGLRLPAGEHKIELRSTAGTRGGAAKVKLGQGETLRMSLTMPKAGK
jgi:serine/threonine protein kinase